MNFSTRRVIIFDFNEILSNKPIFILKFALQMIVNNLRQSTFHVSLLDYFAISILTALSIACITAADMEYCASVQEMLFSQIVEGFVDTI